MPLSWRSRGTPLAASGRSQLSGLAACLFCLWLALAGTSTWASPLAINAPVSLAQLEQRIDLAPIVTYWLDTDQTATLTSLPPATSPEWQTNTESKVNFGSTRAAFWLRVSFTDLAQLRETTYIRLDYPHLDVVDLYLLDDDGVLQHVQTGDTRPFDNRVVRHRTFLLPLPTDHSGPVGVVIRVATQGPMQLPLDLITRSALDAEEKPLHIWFGVYFGVMAIMLLYNGVIFIFVRDLSYLLYLVYIMTTAALQFTLYGFSFEYLWPASTTLNNLMILLLTGCMPFTAIAFVWRFIDLSRIGDRYDIAMTTLLLAGFAAVLLGAFVMPYMTTLKLAHVMSFIAVSAGFYLGVKYWIKGVKAARIFALAWFVYMVFIVYYLLAITGAIQPDLVSRHALEIGSALEVALLSLAFADRLNAEKELRLNAQLKLNQDLDLLVRERTDELEKANQRLKEISNTDGLTGLCNRRHFDEIFALEFQRAFRDKTCLAVLMIDVDHFKSINDTYGHPFGDACLQQLAQLIGDAIRRPPDLAARYGGEEFVVLLPATDLEGALHVAENIRAAVEKSPVRDQGHHAQITASVGVMSAIPAHRDQREAFLSRADAQLYHAKRNGRNRVEGTDSTDEPAATTPSLSSRTAG